MPSPYTGDPNVNTQREAVSVPFPVDADPFNAALIGAALKALADPVAFLQQNVLFTSSSSRLGFLLAAYDSARLLPLLRFPSGPDGTRNLVADFYGPAGFGRLYQCAAGLEITVNARWNGTSWTKDDSSAPALLVSFGGTSGITFKQYTPAAGTFADAAWSGTGRIAPTQGPAPSLLHFSNRAGTVLNVGTSYLSPYFLAGTAPATEDIILCHAEGRVHRLLVNSPRAPTSQTITYTVRKNGIDTALAVTVDDTGTPERQVTNNNQVITVVAGDKISVKASLTGSTGIGGSVPIAAAMQLSLT
ncbi:MAG: hypothetical protein ACK4N5_01400 [Myxococcales bacterium]